jgi:hypothetical protein
MKIRQAFLRSVDGHETLTTWLDIQPKLVKGANISLKEYGPDKRWIVEELYDDVRDVADFDWHRKWDNNI